MAVSLARSACVEVSQRRRYERLAIQADLHARTFYDANPRKLLARTGELAAMLAVQGINPSLLVQLLGCVAAHVHLAMGIRIFPTQLFCAAALLEQHMAEMATGEGKTLAAGMAAAVGALVGTPVHVLTANEYLAGRDAQTLEPLYRSLQSHLPATILPLPSSVWLEWHASRGGR